MQGPAINDIDVRNIIVKSNLPVCDYSANPYVGCTHGCMYCYASFMKRFTGHTEPWGEFLDVKHWQPVRHPERYSGKEVFLGSVTDPYNPEEERFERTRKLLEELRGGGVKLSIATKSDLVRRDLDIRKTVPAARVSWSVNTLDESFKDDMDRAVSIERRLEAMRIFHENGIRTTCFISPIFPGITDAKAIIRRAKDICNLIWLENLNLRGSFKGNVMGYINSKHPELMPLYEDIYNHGSKSYWIDLDSDLRAFALEIGLDYVRNDDSMKRPFDDPPIIVNYFYHEEIKKNARR